MQKVFGCIWWDYNDKPFNYKGILCLESTIAWGFYTLFLFMFLQKWVNSFVGLYPRSIGVYLGAGLIIYYLVDFTISLIGAIDLNVKLKKLSAIIDEMQERLKKIHIVPKREHIFEKLEDYIGFDTSILPDVGLKELAEKYRLMRSKNPVLSRHFIRSYQAFKVWGRKEREKDQPQQQEKGELETIREDV